MATLLEALAFAARVLDIFPMDLGSKRPSISFIEQATHDPERIKQLWRDPITGTKDYNIGVLCGGQTRLIIVDIDTKNDAKFKCSAIANYEAIGGHFNTLVIKTASGGLQAYFRLPVGMTFRNMQGIVPNVDIRCEHGYGIGPGSFSIESGGGYEIHVDMEIAELPEVFIPLLKPLKTRKERFNGHADTDKAIVLYTEYLSRVEPAIEGQGGDQHTFNVACMGVRDYGLSEPTVFALMLTHFNDRCEPPWDADELQRKVENAENYAIGETGSRDPEKILEGVVYTPAALVEPVTALAHETLSDTLLDDIPAIDFLVYPLLVQREVTMMIGPGGVGKSMLLIAMSCHAVVGRDFGPYKIQQPFDVLLYNPEDSRPIISGRAAVACSSYSIDLPYVKQHFRVLSQDNKSRILVDYSNRKMTIPDETVRYFSEHRERHVDCKVIIIDPLRKMLRGINENDNAQMSEAMNCLNAFAYMLNVALLVSHHTGKNLMQRKDLDPDSPDLSVGAGSVVSSARIICNVLPQTPFEAMTQGVHNNYFSSRIVKSNSGPIGETTWWERRIIHHPNGGSYPVAMPTDARDAAHLMHRSYINAVGDHMITYSKNSISVRQAALAIKDQYPSPRSEKSTSDLLRTLFQRGAVTQPYTDIASGRQYAMVLNTEDDKRYSLSLVETDIKPISPALILPEYKAPGEDEDDAPAPPLA